MQSILVLANSNVSGIDPGTLESRKLSDGRIVTSVAGNSSQLQGRSTFNCLKRNHWGRGGEAK